MRNALAALEAIGKPDPKNGTEYFRWSRPICQFLNASDTAWFADMLKVATANGVTETTMKAVNDGMIASGAALSFADLPTTAVRFKIPYYVIQGRDDLVAPTPLVEAYFNKLSAPKKRLFVINGAGHFALATDQAEVIGAETDPSLNTQNEARVELKAFTIRHPWLTATLTFTTGG